MREVARQIERVASTDVTVLIHGESGTGKELVARAIHEHSGRRTQQFLALNCAALPETLQEAELFGYEKGAFTGAAARRLGRFEQVAGGTLFLDEVAELSAGAQSKLLRVLQERVVQRVGGNDEVPVDFRLVTATHRDLADEVKKGRFREDLYFRIVVFELELPPLRLREGDVRVLTRHFIEKHGPRLINAAPDLDPEALAVMMRHAWPGNVRELENTLQRAMVSCDRSIIRKGDLPPRLVGEGEHGASPTPPPGAINTALGGGAAAPSGNGLSALKDSAVTLEQAERQLILTALERCNGNRSMVSQQLGIGRTTLYRKLKEYGLE
jgi:DNA-binding NtrC family response regulator